MAAFIFSAGVLLHLPDGEAATDHKCSADKAGLGKELSCYDVLANGKKGPEMVVVPAGSASDKPYAIGKYEVSGTHYNRYCQSNVECEPLTLSRYKLKLPVTGISAEDARSYAKWLSERASRSAKTEVIYRLPTDAEWEWAANARGGFRKERGVNCRVTAVGGQILTFPRLIDARAGIPNEWGLVNFIGNAQEWVTEPSGNLAARGGSFEDTLKDCEVSLKRTHDGTPDKKTGFRLVRELE